METHIKGRSHHVGLLICWLVPDTCRKSYLQGLPWPARSWDLGGSLPPQCTCAHTDLSYKQSPCMFFKIQPKYSPAYESFSGQYATVTEMFTPSFVSTLYASHNYVIISIMIYYTSLFTCLSLFTKLWTFEGKVFSKCLRL